ncbi:MAG: Gfo/Idh/MocA family oxidoreductase [Planctomycetia bacterium]|jgi:predicted dehydrogenase
MSHHPTRRQFIQTSAAIGIGYYLTAGARGEDKPVPPSDRIRLAGIGVGGKGRADVSNSSQFGEYVALCDTDTKRLEMMKKRLAKKKEKEKEKESKTVTGTGKATGAGTDADCKMYTDFRKLLEEMGDQIDAVTISTPDHTHAAATLMAMRMGKHVYCQKPLTHSIYEARLVSKVAKETGVATQMGNQGTQIEGLRKAAAMLRAGVLGKVKEVHVWTDRPIWAQGGPRPESVPCPKTIKWDQWIGPAKMRPYAKGYHPFAWRGFWDFGTGALGDMACHTMNMPFQGLDLRDPISVVATTAGHNEEMYPKWSEIEFEFAATDTRGPMKLIWHDGGKLPDMELFEGRQPSKSGSLTIGEKGKLYSPHDYGKEYELIGVDPIEAEYRKPVPGMGNKYELAHHKEWFNAIRGGEPAMSNFVDYAGPLTEMCLLGNLAVWAGGQKIEWDAKNLKSSVPGLEENIKPVYRKGYTLDV